LPLTALLLPLTACRRKGFPVYPADYHEFAYVTDGGSNTVTVLDLVYLREDRNLTVGKNPTGLAANPVRDEVYAVNTGSGTVSVINSRLNRVDATIGVHRAPYFIEVAPDGKRAYVPNSGSNTVSVINLDTRREIATAATGEAPGVARVSPDNHTLIVTNRAAGSVSVYTINPQDEVHPLDFREAFSGCPGATDAIIEPDSPEFPTYGAKAFVACSGGHQVMDIWLGAAPDSWRAKQDPSLTHDALLAMLDVGQTPVHLALKPDGGEVFATNFNSDSISEISTWTNEVEGTYVIGAHPSRAVISHDDSSLWVTNFGADSASLYSIADGRMVTGVRTGSRPDALAFSNDEHLLLVVDSGSADVSVIRTQDGVAPTLFTILPAGPQPNDIVVQAFRAKAKTVR
jgi:YVTN family beta-propeller protein